MNDFLVKLVPSQPWTPAMLSWLIIASTLAMYAQLLLFGNPKGLEPIILGRILGTLDTAFGVVLAFWLGASRSSRDKDETIKNIATGKREPWTDEQRKSMGRVKK